jgi:hypothetical protein
MVSLLSRLEKVESVGQGAFRLLRAPSCSKSAQSVDHPGILLVLLVKSFTAETGGTYKIRPTDTVGLICQEKDQKRGYLRSDDHILVIGELSLKGPSETPFDFSVLTPLLQV